MRLDTRASPRSPHARTAGMADGELRRQTAVSEGEMDSPSDRNIVTLRLFF